MYSMIPPPPTEQPRVCTNMCSAICRVRFCWRGGDTWQSHQPPQNHDSSMHDRSPIHETNLNYAVGGHGSIPPPAILIPDGVLGWELFSPVSCIFTGLYVLFRSVRYSAVTTCQRQPPDRLQPLFKPLI